jgi:hypothetical protein
MKRRNVLLGITGGLAAPAIVRIGSVKAAANLDPSRLTGELTPLGAERAASTSGLVPAWTGGATTSPAGWTPDMSGPNLFPGQAPSFTVTQANVQQYAHLLCDGQVQMLNRYGAKGYKINVYPTARTAAAPQFVYDNSALNVTRTRPVGSGIVWGFEGGYLGVPFPILSDDPVVAGGQAIWNHNLRWGGTFFEFNLSLMIGGTGSPVICTVSRQSYWYPYYDQYQTLAQYESNPRCSWIRIDQTAPANELGQTEIGGYSSNYERVPSVAFEYLIGEGRIRQAPDINYDIPNAQSDDVINIDEIDLFSGKMDRYVWTLRGKKEMIVPYNQWAIVNTPTSQVFGPDTVNQDLMRYEVHRVWVVEATLAPGKRHVMPHRFFYIDEDTWQILATDGYDAQGNYWKYGQLLVQAQPQAPGTTLSGFVIHNFQSNAYLMGGTFYADPAPIGGFPLNFEPQPHPTWSPQALANSGGL